MQTLLPPQSHSFVVRVQGGPLLRCLLAACVCCRALTARCAFSGWWWWWLMWLRWCCCPVLVQTLISTYANDKLLRGQFSFSGKDSNGEPW